MTSAAVGRILSEKDACNGSFLKARDATSATTIFTPPFASDRRFYFEKQNGPPRLINSQTMSFESGTREGPILSRSNTFDFRPQATEEIQHAPAKRSLFPFDLPHEFPLTRTVSTSTDLDNTSDSELNYCGIFMKHVNKSTTTTVHSSSSVGTTTTKGILKGQVKTKGNCQGKRNVLRRSKEDLFNEFCKKTGRFIKPRNIYYIDDEGAEERALPKEDQHTMVLSPRELHYRDEPLLTSQPNLNQIGRSKSFQADYPEPLYVNHFERRRSPMMMYQSQTLPRNFLKGSSQSNLNIPAPRQFAQHGLGNGHVNRSFDNILGSQGNWPKCIPTSPSPSLYSSRSCYNQQRCLLQPHRGNAYSSRDSLVRVRQEMSGFDLDKIEKDCRISHASLFQGHHNELQLATDYSKSTAV